VQSELASYDFYETLVVWFANVQVEITGGGAVDVEGCSADFLALYSRTRSAPVLGTLGVLVLSACTKAFGLRYSLMRSVAFVLGMVKLGSMYRHF
jgi:hypothetical protein